MDLVALRPLHRSPQSHQCFRKCQQVVSLFLMFLYFELLSQFHFILHQFIVNLKWILRHFLQFENKDLTFRSVRGSLRDRTHLG